MENSAPYASYSERTKWFDEVIGNVPSKCDRPHPLLAEIDLSGFELENLRMLVLDFIAHSMSARNGSDAIGRLEGSQFTPDRTASSYLVPIEAWLVEALHKLFVGNRIAALEYPANVRVVHGKPVPSYVNQNYATTNIHSDIWAGEPADTVQGIIPLMGDVTATFCQWYNIDLNNFDLYVSKLKSYAAAESIVSSSAPISHTFNVGKLYLFDSALPHQTKQLGGQMRISLDFRIRRIFPYADVSWSLPEHWSEGTFRKYYLFPPSPYPHKSLLQKIENEISILDRLGLTQFAELRRGEKQ